MGIGSSVSSSNEPGKFNYVSSGMSSYHDGNEMTGMHSFINNNGQIHQETTGNLPTGFFSSIFQSSVPLTTMILSISVLSIIAAVFVTMRKRRRTPNGLFPTSGIELKRKTDGGSYSDRIFPLSNKRPLAEALWNSDLLDQLVVVGNDN